MKKEFARFFGDKRLVFTTILMPGLMIYILYTLLGQGIMKQFCCFGGLCISDLYGGSAGGVFLFKDRV